MHGQAVDLPEGYAGVVLRTPNNKMGKGLYSRYRKKEEKPKSSGWTTRRSKCRQEEAKVEDEADAPGFSGQTRVRHAFLNLCRPSPRLYYGTQTYPRMMAAMSMSARSENGRSWRQR